MLAFASLAPGSAPASAKTSNPAFLGVGMQDRGGGGQGPCTIVTITKDSGAHAAGLRAGDDFVAIEGAPVANCNDLVTQIQRREAGEEVKIVVRRFDTTTTINARLLSRADVMRQRVIGQMLPIATLVRVDTERKEDLGSRGKTTIVGWFDQRGCRGCEQAFGTVARWARGKSTRSAPIEVFAATVGNDHRSLLENTTALKSYARTLDVPLLVTEADSFGDITITDGERIIFMVIDSRGVVQYVAPLLPGADDRELVLEELYAASEQIARRSR